MNYIELINKFWLTDLEANFTHLELHLYFKLLEINNRLQWKEYFRYPNSRLEVEVGSRPKNLISARQKLADYSLIEYQKGTTRLAGKYRILPAECTFVPTKESNQGSNEKVIRGTLDKQKKTKQVSINKGFDLDFVSEVLKPLVLEFIRYRKQDLRRPFKTIRGVEQFYLELVKISGDNFSTAQDLVKQAINKEWRTVYPPYKNEVTRKFRNSSIAKYDKKL